MTDARAAELRALLRGNAVQLPWRIKPSLDGHVEGRDLTSGDWRLVAGCRGYATNVEAQRIDLENEANAELIVAAVNALPALLDERDALTQQVSLLTDSVEARYDKRVADQDKHIAELTADLASAGGTRVARHAQAHRRAGGRGRPAGR